MCLGVHLSCMLQGVDMRSSLGTSLRRVLTRTIQFENNSNICIILSERVVSGISVDFGEHHPRPHIPAH